MKNRSKLYIVRAAIIWGLVIVLAMVAMFTVTLFSQIIELYNGGSAALLKDSSVGLVCSLLFAVGFCSIPRVWRTIKELV